MKKCPQEKIVPKALRDECINNNIIPEQCWTYELDCPKAKEIWTADLPCKGEPKPGECLECIKRKENSCKRTHL